MPAHLCNGMRQQAGFTAGQLDTCELNYTHINVEAAETPLIQFCIITVK